MGRAVAILTSHYIFLIAESELERGSRILVDLAEPYERLYDRCVAARMLGIVAWSPGYSTVLLSVPVAPAVPTVKHIVGQIGGQFEIVFRSGYLICADQLAREPHLVVIYIEDTGHIGLTASA